MDIDAEEIARVCCPCKVSVDESYDKAAVAPPVPCRARTTHSLEVQGGQDDGCSDSCGHSNHSHNLLARCCLSVTRMIRASRTSDLQTSDLQMFSEPLLSS